MNLGSQRRYQWLKLLELAVAAALPVVAGVGSPVWVTGGLAAVIVVLEGAQHLYQFQEQWITYRSTAEALTRERYLYLTRSLLNGRGSADRVGRVDPVVRAVGCQRADCPACLPQATHPMTSWTRPPGVVT